MKNVSGKGQAALVMKNCWLSYCVQAHAERMQLTWLEGSCIMQENRACCGIHQFSISRLMRIKGIGKVKAIQISCISELAKRLARTSYEDSLCFSNPSSIAGYYMEELRHREAGNHEITYVELESKVDR